MVRPGGFERPPVILVRLLRTWVVEERRYAPDYLSILNRSVQLVNTGHSPIEKEFQEKHYDERANRDWKAGFYRRTAKHNEADYRPNCYRKAVRDRVAKTAHGSVLIPFTESVL